jgi:DNA polymerase V
LLYNVQCDFSNCCAEKLRAQQSCCSAITVFIRTNGQRKDLPQYDRSITIQLPFATNSTLELTQFSIQALQKIFKTGYAYKKAGVIVSYFTPQNAVQKTIFENSNPRHAALMQAIDTVNTLHGQHKIRLAAQDQKRVWKMKQEKKSPQYTTRLSDIITIYV